MLIQYVLMFVVAVQADKVPPWPKGDATAPSTPAIAGLIFTGAALALGSLRQCHLRKQLRDDGRGYLTIVEGLGSDVDKRQLLRSICKQLRTKGSIQQDPKTKMHAIVVHGDFRVAIQKLLTDRVYLELLCMESDIPPFHRREKKDAAGAAWA